MLFGIWSYRNVARYAREVSAHPSCDEYKHLEIVNCPTCSLLSRDIDKRAGELSDEEMEKLTNIMLNPASLKIPDWFFNRQKDIRMARTRSSGLREYWPFTGFWSRSRKNVLSTNLESKNRDDFERMKKIRLHRGFAFVDSTPRLLVASVALLEFPRKRAVEKT
uniref:Small ribosomal subunit protein uS13 n=1 Tax=Ditylenchus dipsaci TaxID=166011 RepID=A0A915DP84_9BILA